MPSLGADMAAGTLVVNDPASLANAVNKTYFQHFPEVVRPRTLISRDPGDISSFVNELRAGAVLKPLQGSGGTSVFFVSNDESPNLNQMIEAVGRDGYIVAQEVLPEAAHGDVRRFFFGHHMCDDRRRHGSVGLLRENAGVDEAFIGSEALRDGVVANKPNCANGSARSIPTSTCPWVRHRHRRSGPRRHGCGRAGRV